MLARDAVRSFLERPLKNYDWAKDLSKAELYDELGELKHKYEFKTEPWKHQLACFLIGAYKRRFLFNLGMGGGKTKLSSDLVAYYNAKDGLQHRVLVTVPRLVNLDTWEAQVPRHTNLTAYGVAGSIEAKRDALMAPAADFTVIDYQGLALACTMKVKKTNGKGNRLVPDWEFVDELRKKYSFVIIDEIHKCKTHDGLYARILRRITRDVKNVYGLTGTLFDRDPQDVWSQFNLIDKGETFGETLGIFRAAYFAETQGWFGGYEYKIKPDMMGPFHSAMKNRSIRYSDEELESLPELVTQRIEVHMSQDQKKDYYNAVKGLIAASGNLREIDAAFVRMRQISAGYLPFKDDEGNEHLMRYAESPKVDALMDYVDNTPPSEKLVVFTEFTESGRLITEALAEEKVKYVWVYGGNKDNRGTLAKFIKDPKIKVLVANSESGGTGVDGLQDIARRVIFYEPPVSGITRAQAVKRVWRSGQKHKTFLIDFVSKRSVDLHIHTMLEQGTELKEMLVEGRLKAFLKDIEGDEK